MLGTVLIAAIAFAVGGLVVALPTLLAIGRLAAAAHRQGFEQACRMVGIDARLAWEMREAVRAERTGRTLEDTGPSRDHLTER